MENKEFSESYHELHTVYSNWVLKHIDHFVDVNDAKRIDTSIESQEKFKKVEEATLKLLENMYALKRKIHGLP